MIFKKQMGILVAAILAATDISFAQTFSITPNDSINITGVWEDLQTLSIQQPNISSDTIILKWKKVSETVPALWDAAVCDNAICNTTLVDSGMMNPVIPADYGLLLLHITPHVNYGTAVIRYAVWDTAYPNLKDTLTYILSVSSTSGIATAENKNAFRIFPNPAKDNFSISTHLQNGFQFLITGVLGEEIEKGFSRTNSISISTKDFTNGIYQVVIMDENKIISSKKIIIHK